MSTLRLDVPTFRIDAPKREPHPSEIYRETFDALTAINEIDAQERATAFDRAIRELAQTTSAEHARADGREKSSVELAAEMKRRSREAHRAHLDLVSTTHANGRPKMSWELAEEMKKRSREAHKVRA